MSDLSLSAADASVVDATTGGVVNATTTDYPQVQVELPEPPSAVVSLMHAVPRFGHSSRIANLASSHQLERNQYVNGILAFLVFLGLFALVWIIVLVLLKYSFGSSRVGCAAGGKPVDVIQLRRDGRNKNQRKAIIRRNWRTQTSLFVLCLCVPILSFLFVNHGVRPFFSSLKEFQSLSTSISKKSVEGVNVATRLISVRNRMEQLVSSLNVTEYCPNVGYGTTPFENIDEDDNEDVSEIMSEIQMDGNLIMFNSLHGILMENMYDIEQFVEGHARTIALGLSRVSEINHYIDVRIDTTLDSEWMIYCFLITLNVVNLLLIIGVVMCRFGINYQPYQGVLAWFIVPTFTVLLAATIGATGITASMALLNADFCSGGSGNTGSSGSSNIMVADNDTTTPIITTTGIGSPKGTLLDILSEKGYGTTDLPYQVVDYYTSNCNGPNPVSFLYNFGVDIGNKDEDINALLNGMNAFDTSTLDAVCGRSIQPLNETLYQLVDKLSDLEGILETATNLTACDNVQPITRSLIDGATCQQSPSGTAWLFATTLAMTLVGLSMLSTRAGLYNPVLKPRRVKRREREFKEYQQYMGDFYETSKWQMDPTNSATKANNRMIVPAGTFDTAEMSSSPTGSSSTDLSLDEEDNANHHSLPPPPVESVTAKKATRSSPIPASVGTVVARLRHDLNRHLDVEFYSSDSDDEEDDDEDNNDNNESMLGGGSSVMSGISNISALVSRTVSLMTGNDNTFFQRDDDDDNSTFASPALPTCSRGCRYSYSPTNALGGGGQNFPLDEVDDDISTTTSEGTGPKRKPPPSAFLKVVVTTARPSTKQQEEMNPLTPKSAKETAQAMFMERKANREKQKQQQKQQRSKKEVKAAVKPTTTKPSSSVLKYVGRK